MARTKAAEKSTKVSSDYPQGKHTVTWQNIDEDDWWLIINLIRGRIEYFQSRLDDLIRTNDPDLIHNQTKIRIIMAYRCVKPCQTTNIVFMQYK